MTNFNLLPVEIQAKAKRILKAYDKVYVDYEYGEYHVSVGVAIKTSYAEDHKFVGEYKAEEIYTENERAENYINTYGSYPSFYKGKRDYDMIRRLEDDKIIDFENKTITCPIGKINDQGDFEIVGTKTIRI